MRVALATCGGLPDGDEDRPELVAALADVGVHATCEVWDAPAVAWASFDAVVIRSTWDYAVRRDAFLAWADDVAAVTALYNPVRLVRDNTDKRYLGHLARAGVPVVPTLWPTPGEPLPQLWPDIVVKPTVSAGCLDTARFAGDTRHKADAFVAQLHAAGRRPMVQPYQAGIDAGAETAVILFDGVYSHAASKAAMLRPDQGLEKGMFRPESIRPRDATAAQRAVALQALQAVGAMGSLYARVDLVPGDDGAPCVLEVELSEPSLFLGRSAGAAERFAAAIRGRL
jgi:glutathione synthase/RimK-type ligase-like ATP-grasp enzyme